MDGSPIGETAAKMLDLIDGREGEVVAVAVVAIIDQEDGDEDVLLACTHDREFEQTGILHAALGVSGGGVSAEPEADDS